MKIARLAITLILLLLIYNGIYNYDLMNNYRSTDRPVNPLRYIFFIFYFILIAINLLEFILGKFKYSSFKKVFYYFIFLSYLICIFMFKYNDYPIQGLTLMGYFTLVGISTFLFNLLNKNKPIPRRIQKK